MKIIEDERPLSSQTTIKVVLHGQTHRSAPTDTFQLCQPSDRQNHVLPLGQRGGCGADGVCIGADASRVG